MSIFTSMPRPKLFPPSEQPEVPMYDVLNGYKWVDDFVKMQGLKEKIRNLIIQRQELEARPSDKTSIKERLKKSYSALHKQRIEWFLRFISENLECENPLGRFYDRSKDPYAGNLTPFFRWEEIEEALDQIPEVENGINSADREAALEKIEKEIAELKTAIRTLSPDKYFLKRDGQIMADAREILLKAWWKTQSEVQKPCNVFGVSLKLCPKPEQAAWKRLDLKPNPYGKFVPTAEFPKAREPEVSELPENPSKDLVATFKIRRQTISKGISLDEKDPEQERIKKVFSRP